MKTNVLSWIVLVLLGCNSDGTPPKTASLATTEPTAPAEPKGFPAAPTALSAGLKAIRPADIPKHIPKGLIMKSFVQGNLNGDDIEDVLLIAENPADKDAPRQVLVLEGQKDATLKVADLGTQAALCEQCGGMMGDPFQEALILKDNSFRLDFFGGSRWKWARTIDFQYDTNRKKWLLVRDEYTTHDGANIDKPTQKLRTPQDKGFVKTPLATFDASKDQ